MAAASQSMEVAAGTGGVGMGAGNVVSEWGLCSQVGARANPTVLLPAHIHTLHTLYGSSICV